MRSTRRGRGANRDDRLRRRAPAPQRAVPGGSGHPAGDRVLDIGCGTGQTTREAALQASDGDADRAFRNIARAVRTGGRLVMMVWGAHDRNEWAVAIDEARVGDRRERGQNGTRRRHASTSLSQRRIPAEGYAGSAARPAVRRVPRWSRSLRSPYEPDGPGSVEPMAYDACAEGSRAVSGCFRRRSFCSRSMAMI